MKIKSFPKVNLNLFVTGKKDGLHILDSIFVEVQGDLFDELEITLEEGSGLVLNSDIENNTISKAYEILKDRLNKKVIVNLTKNIPMMGGLGGGSSNAAAFINCVNEMFDLNLKSHELIKIAAQVGSDVPFFINGGVARVQGTGNLITILNVEPPLIDLYTNDFKLSTKEVFDNFDTKDCHKNTMKDMILALKQGTIRKELLVNDLTKAIYRTNEEYKEFVEKENKNISGSGSTLFELV